MDVDELPELPVREAVSVSLVFLPTSFSFMPVVTAPPLGITVSFFTLVGAAIVELVTGRAVESAASALDACVDNAVPALSVSTTDDVSASVDEASEASEAEVGSDVLSLIEVEDSANVTSLSESEVVLETSEGEVDCMKGSLSDLPHRVRTSEELTEEVDVDADEASFLT